MIAGVVGFTLCGGVFWIVSRWDLALHRELAAYGLALACTAMLAGLI